MNINNFSETKLHEISELISENTMLIFTETHWRVINLHYLRIGILLKKGEIYQIKKGEELWFYTVKIL